MSGFFRTVFGGSESKASSTSTPKDVTPPEFQALREPLAQTFLGLLSGGAEDPFAGIPSFGGDLTANIAPGEEQLLATLQGLGSGRGSELLGRTLAGDFIPTQLDPFTAAAIQASIAPFQRQQEEFLTRQLPSQFGAAGQRVNTPGGSSAASRFGAITSADIAQRAAEVGANLAFQQTEAERERQQEAIQLGQEEVNTAVENLKAQALPRIIDELGIERGLEEFQKRIQNLLAALSLATGAPISQVATQATSTQKSTSQKGIIPALGGFLSGAADFKAAS